MDRKRNISLLPSLLLSSLWLLWLLWLALASGSARAAPTAARYTVAEIGGRGADGLAINGLGNIAGVVRDGDLPQAFLYANGAFTRLGTLGGAESFGAGVNDGGHVVGMSTTADNHRRAFFYANGAMTDIGTLGGNESTAAGINNAGQTVGSAANGDNDWHAFRYTSGTMQDLGTLGGTNSFANGINNANEVVGTSNILGDAASHAFLYSDSAMHDLNTLIDPALGWTIHFAYGINDHGQIAAAGCRAGECVAVRLDLAVTAVPEPSAWTTMACGLALLALSLHWGKAHNSHKSHTTQKTHRAPPVFRLAG